MGKYNTIINIAILCYNLTYNNITHIKNSDSSVIIIVIQTHVQRPLREQKIT